MSFAWGVSGAEGVVGREGGEAAVVDWGRERLPTGDAPTKTGAAVAIVCEVIGMGGSVGAGTTSGLFFTFLRGFELGSGEAARLDDDEAGGELVSGSTLTFASR